MLARSPLSHLSSIKYQWLSFQLASLCLVVDNSTTNAITIATIIAAATATTTRVDAKVPDPKPATYMTAYRPARSDRMSAARMDRATQLKLSEADMVVTGEKGYCMCRATHGVYTGDWYYEIEVLAPEKVGDASYPEAHTRLGWAQRYGNLQGPTGVDDFSYSWRDVSCSERMYMMYRCTVLCEYVYTFITVARWVSTAPHPFTHTPARP